MKKNYHTHTVRCNHADGTEREYIEKALEAGFVTLGFSDHSPYIFKGDYYSSFRMRPEELDGYVETLRALREEYKDRIEILIGLEAEYYPENWQDYISFIRGKGVEYLILGQHYPKGEYPGALYSGRESDDRQRVEDYVTSIVDGVRTGLFSYVAHPGLIRFSGDRLYFEKKLDQMVTEVQREGVPFEINLLGLREGRHYPSEFVLSILQRHHAEVILGSDAHEPRWVYHEETVKRAERIALHYGLRITEEIDVGRLKRHGI